MLTETVVLLLTSVIALASSLGGDFERSNLTEFKFDTIITHVDIPFYKLFLSIGKCKKIMLYTEERAWGKIKLNRILDIYYKSSNPDMKVSRVEIDIVINNTDCAAYSTYGVGFPEFAARMFIPTYVAMIFYRLTVFSCSKPIIEDSEAAQLGLSSDENNQDEKLKKVPYYLWPIRPARPPHHIFYTNDTVIYDDPPRRPTTTEAPKKKLKKQEAELTFRKGGTSDEFTSNENTKHENGTTIA